MCSYSIGKISGKEEWNKKGDNRTHSSLCFRSRHCKGGRKVIENPNRLFQTHSPTKPIPPLLSSPLIQEISLRKGANTKPIIYNHYSQLKTNLSRLQNFDISCGICITKPINYFPIYQLHMQYQAGLEKFVKCYKNH